MKPFAKKMEEYQLNRRRTERQPEPGPQRETESDEPHVDTCFYRKHTHGILRRYLYCSLQPNRIGATLRDPVGRGWVSSRPIHSFVDAILFCYDVERCLSRLDSLDRVIIEHIVLREYQTYEAAALLGMSPRTVVYRLGHAIDKLTELLIRSEVLMVTNAA